MPRTGAIKNPPARALDAPSRRRLPPLLRHAWYNLNQAFRRRIAPSGLTPDQFTILRTLTEAGAAGLTQRELAASMSSDPNTISALLKRMEISRLVACKPHESDLRKHRICLQAAGRRMYVQLREIALELQGQVLAALPEARREAFLEQLEAVAEAAHRAARPERKEQKR